MKIDIEDYEGELLIDLLSDIKESLIDLKDDNNPIQKLYLDVLEQRINKQIDIKINSGISLPKVISILASHMGGYEIHNHGHCIYRSTEGYVVINNKTKKHKTFDDEEEAALNFVRKGEKADENSQDTS